MNVNCFRDIDIHIVNRGKDILVYNSRGKWSPSHSSKGDSSGRGNHSGHCGMDCSSNSPKCQLNFIIHTEHGVSRMNEWFLMRHPFVVTLCSVQLFIQSMLLIATPTINEKSKNHTAGGSNDNESTL